MRLRDCAGFSQRVSSRINLVEVARQQSQCENLQNEFAFWNNAAAEADFATVATNSPEGSAFAALARETAATTAMSTETSSSTSHKG